MKANKKHFNEAREKLEKWADDLVLAAEKALKDTKEQILDDIENAEAPKVEQYLVQIRILRRIAQQLIAFLSQLEDFQKKLWLKKKFVTEALVLTLIGLE